MRLFSFYLKDFIEMTGGLTILLKDTVLFALKRPYEIRPLVNQLHEIGVRSLSITNLTLLFTGMVLVLQTSYSLKAYGVRTYIGDFVALSIIRELGPVLTAIMIGARVGAGITAEIGSMNVTEQIDALRALASSPVKKLVVPRVVAMLIILPLVTIIAIFVGIMGGCFIAYYEVGQTAQYFMQHVIKALTITDIANGIGKTFFFALIISIIACYNGMTATGGADGVGRATTKTVVSASISIFIADFFLTKLFLLLS
jgi:phospholipid/cholesterol/gamma-HCH transport system permease protein